MATVMPHQRWFQNDPPQVLSGVDALLLHGWTRAAVFAFVKSAIAAALERRDVNVDALCQDLAGNSFVATVIGAFEMNIIKNLTPHMLQFAKQTWEAVLAARSDGKKRRTIKRRPAAKVQEEDELLKSMMEKAAESAGGASDAEGASAGGASDAEV